MTKGTVLEKAIVGFDDCVPRALPWAIVLRPAGAGLKPASRDARLVLRFVDAPVISSIPPSVILRESAFVLLGTAFSSPVVTPLSWEFEHFHPVISSEARNLGPNAKTFQSPSFTSFEPCFIEMTRIDLSWMSRGSRKPSRTT